MGSTTELEIEVNLSYLENKVNCYCEEKGINNKEIPPLQWVNILYYLADSLFIPYKQKLLLKDNSKIYGEYDKDKVLYIYKLYTRLSTLYNQEISQKGFLNLTDIDKQTLYNWEQGKVGSSPFDLNEKIRQDNQESLEKLMMDKRYNPMKFLPKLNRYHGYNMSGVRENSQKTSLEFSQLPSLNCSNSTNNLLPDGTNNE